MTSLVPMGGTEGGSGKAAHPEAFKQEWDVAYEFSPGDWAAVERTFALQRLVGRQLKELMREWQKRERAR